MIGAMNALALRAAARPQRRGLTARRWLIVLLAFESVAALCATVALALSAPGADSLLGQSLGGQAIVALLLLAGLAAALAVTSFNATGALLRDRPHAELTAGGIQLAILAAGVTGLLTAGVKPELVAVGAIGLVGLALAALSAGSARR